MSRANFLAACCIAIAATSLVRAQPPTSGQTGTQGDQAAEQQPAPSDRSSAGADAARADEPAGADGVPSWVFDTWCSSEGAPTPTGWSISRDHRAGVRFGARTHEGTWSVVGVTPSGAELEVDNDLGEARLIFRRPIQGPSGDVMYSAGMYYDPCGAINFNERF